MGTEFQTLALWYLINFWHREKENFEIYRFFLVEDRVRRLWIELKEKNEKTQGGRASFFQLQMCTDQQFFKYLAYKSEELPGFGNYS